MIRRSRSGTPSSSGRARRRLKAVDRIGGYPVVRLLGAGGMGAVFLGIQERVGRRLVAIKVMHGTDPALVDRMDREIRTLGEIQSPRIVQVFDSGQDTSGRPFLVMEYCAGGSIADQLRTRGASGPAEPGDGGSAPQTARLALGEVGSVLASVAEALAVLHRAGVVHRDVKPRNILITQHGEALLGDFGIVRVGDETTNSGVVGTGAYLSPELLAGEPATAASDVYAFGVSAYELLSGTRPYSGTTPAIADSARAERRTPLGKAAPECPATVVELIESCLAADPAQRPSDLGAVAATIRKAIGCTPVQVMPLSDETVQDAGLSGGDARRRRRRPRRRDLIVAAALAAVLLLVNGVLALVPSAPSPPQRLSHSFEVYAQDDILVSTRWAATVGKRRIRATTVVTRTDGLVRSPTKGASPPRSSIGRRSSPVQEQCALDDSSPIDSPEPRDITYRVAFVKLLTPEKYWPRGIALDEKPTACSAARNVPLARESHLQFHFGKMALGETRRITIDLSYPVPIGPRKFTALASEQQSLTKSWNPWDGSPKTPDYSQVDVQAMLQARDLQVSSAFVCMPGRGAQVRLRLLDPWNGTVTVTNQASPNLPGLLYDSSPFASGPLPRDASLGDVLAAASNSSFSIITGPRARAFPCDESGFSYDGAMRAPPTCLDPHHLLCPSLAWFAPSWSSDRPGVVTAGADGQVTAWSKGYATVTATIDSWSDSAFVRVQGAPSLWQGLTSWPFTTVNDMVRMLYAGLFAAALVRRKGLALLGFCCGALAEAACLQLGRNWLDLSRPGATGVLAPAALMLGFAIAASGVIATWAWIGSTIGGISGRERRGRWIAAVVGPMAMAAYYVVGGMLLARVPYFYYPPFHLMVTSCVPIVIGLLILAGGVGRRIGEPKGRAKSGFWLGCTLTVVGWLIVAMLGSKSEASISPLDDDELAEPVLVDR
ncbi:MAG: protein kinase domain-containing protein [Actinomycetes bacterium]